MASKEEHFCNILLQIHQKCTRSGIEESVQWLCYGLGNWGILNCIPASAKIYLFSKTHRLVTGTTKTPNQWVPGALPMEEKWPRHKAECLPPSNAEVNNEWGAIQQFTLMP